MDRHRLAIVIPALNEARTIGVVVSAAGRFGLPVVVDDGSTDETAAVAEAAGASVVRHQHNLGYDGALNSGFARAAELDCDLVITMDADGQHDAAIIGLYVAALDSGCDVVVGVRDRRQRLAEHIFAAVSSLRWGICDPLCGMKGYRTALYRHAGYFDSYGSIGTELVLRAAQAHLRIAQISIRTAGRDGAPRFGRSLSANAGILRALWIALFRPAK